MRAPLRIISGLVVFALVLSFTTWRLLFARSPQSAMDLERQRCPAIADVSRRPLGEADFNGTQERQSKGGFDDDFLTDKDGATKVGVREQWGGALVFFGRGGVNALDASAPGRGVHLSFRDDLRPRQGCSYNESCEKIGACPEGDAFVGWSPSQAGNKCGENSGILQVANDGELRVMFSPLQANPGWNLKTCATTAEVCADATHIHERAPLRISQSVRFVRAGLLEVDALVTNLSDRQMSAKHGELSEWPALYSATGRDATPNFNTLKDAQGEVLKTERRTPATFESLWQTVSAPEGWLTYQSAGDENGIGIYWENRPIQARAEQSKGEFNRLTSASEFILPPHATVRRRYYLMLGGYKDIRATAHALDTSLPPFGRIDVNTIRTDARTVELTGWVLDNKQVTHVELWVDGKKVSDLPLQTQRDDVCRDYPGYAMCELNHSRVGFQATYSRPQGQGCEHPVEIRAQDNDGNWRVVARRSISPIQYQ